MALEVSGRWLRKATWPLLCALVALVGLWADPVVLQGLRNAQFDQFQRWRPRPSVDAGVVVVDIDAASLRQLGQWPWPRHRLADLVDRLRDSGAAVVALDVLLVEPDRTAPAAMAAQWQLPSAVQRVLAGLPDPDAVLAQSLARAPVVLGMVLGTEAGGLAPDLPFRVLQQGEGAVQRLPHLAGATWPLPALLQSASAVGALNFVADGDGVVRRVPLFFSVQGQVVPTLVAEVLRLAQGTQNYLLRGTAQAGGGLEQLRMGALTLPTTAEGEVWVHYRADMSAHTVPAWQVLAGGVDGQRLADKLVLVGASAPGLMDMRANPLGQVIAGVNVHAQALEQILSGQGLRRPGWALGLELVWALLGCLALGLVAVRARAAVSAAVALALLGASAAMAWWAFAHQQLLLNAAEPMVWMALTFVVCSVVQHRATERQQRWMRGAFSRYVSPNRVQHLVEHPEQLALGGRRQECSFIFTDLADFTALVESLEPARTVSLLNAYLDRMVAIAFEHGGTLDRITGDAVAIVFSAPLPQVDHRARALRCALAMDAFASAYAGAVQSEQGIAFGHTRIGVHTGDVIVGNFGGKTMFDYRALGDAVNTASRLEGANKYLGTRICVSAATVQGCDDAAVRTVGELLLKGKPQPLRVYEPLTSRAADYAPPADYAQAYAAMQSQAPSAASLFATLAQRYPHDPLVALHAARLARGEVGVRMVLQDK